jgi:ABC-type metal ion transport system substrate-binding protein
MKQHDEVLRAHKAQALLDDELLNEALDAIDAAVIEQWEACPARDAEGKEALWQLKKTASKFRNILRGYIENGKLATEQLKAFEEKRRFRVF